MLNGQPLDEEPREITPRNGESLKLNRVRFWCASGKSQADLPGHTQHGIVRHNNCVAGLNGRAGNRGRLLTSGI